jgi:hypothetical protein
MPEPSLLQIFIPRLNALEIDYMVTGAIASIIYGNPRLTHDIDVVAKLLPEHAEEVARVFPLAEFYCPPVEIIKLEAGRTMRGHFNIIHHETGMKADVFMVGRDELHLWALSQRRIIEVEGEGLWVAPPEYVILRKLEYYREGKSEKHLQDIKSILELNAEQLDLEAIEKRVRRCGLGKEWRKAMLVNG